MDPRQTTPEISYVGIAIEDLQSGSVELKVFVPSLSPAATTGAFAPGTTTVTTTVNNLDGSTYSGNVKTSNYITATWIGKRNTAYAPTIRQGEQVKITRYSDSDKYYWDAMGRDRTLQQTDRLRLEVGASTSKTSTKDDTNTYFIELDSINNIVQIKTSQANGEPFSYIFKIDTKKGTVAISDNAPQTPNRILLDSENKLIQLNNTSGATFQLKDKDIIIFAPRDIIARAGRQFFIDSPMFTFNKNSAGSFIINTNTLSVNSSNSIFTSTCFGVNGATKLNGAVVAGPIRAPSFISGDIGVPYSASLNDYTQGSYTLPKNVPDLNTTTTSERHVAAWEQVNLAFDLTASYIQELAQKIGLIINTTPMTNAAQQSIIEVMTATPLGS